MYFLVKVAVLVIFVSIDHAQSRKSSLELERSILTSIFNGYDNSIRPSGENGTGIVCVNESCIMDLLLTEACFTSSSFSTATAYIVFGSYILKNFFYYLERAYIPTTALVLLSWIVFWLHQRCSYVRLGIWIGVLVSTIIVTTSINSRSSEVPYTKALGVWIGTCVCFIFCVLLELCLVNNAITSDGSYFALQNQLANDDSMSDVYSTQVTFRQSWRDDRLKYDTKELDYVTLTRLEKIWIPDLFFSNEDSGHFHDMITPNNLIRIFPDGRVLYSTRISMRLFCPMDLKNYPMDNQVCSIVCASYGYTTEDIVFHWKQMDPVQISKTIQLPKFTMNSFNTGYCTSKTNTGEYSCLKVEMHFSRNFFYYLESAYMPTTALVLLSWVVFWLHPRCSNVRLGIWIGVLVSIIIVTTSINSRSPEVSYTKALDVWMGTCVCFIFCVLLELCLVNNAITSDDSYFALQNQLANDDSMSDKNSMKLDDHGKRSQLRNYSSTPLRWLNKYSTKAQRIDVLSRFLFPAAFAFFNFIYWITYSARRM